MSSAILNDFIKLENQIPLFIVITLLELEFENSERATTELAAMLSTTRPFNGSPFCWGLSDGAKLKLKNYLDKKAAPRHLLDLYRMVVRDLLINPTAESNVPVDRDDSYDGTGNINNGQSRRRIPFDYTRSTPRAELLHNAGIEFQPGPLRFEKKRFGRVVTDFLRLLGNLIDSEKDVALLRKAIVIRSWTGSDQDIAFMLNRICDGITYSSIPEIDMVMKKAEEHYHSQWKVWITEFKQENCSKPWYVVSFVLAILILGMTAMKTVYSVMK
ncbi:hypothetical protein SUGI_0699990 [Cryptomeria japonica]|nr:hypothetical protein SUGI_0699990 [Cryptomeria japonica]